MFIHELETLKNQKEDIEKRITNLEKNTLNNVLFKIKKNEEYKKYFFLNNWQLLFLCSCLPEGDCVYDGQNGGEQWDEIFSNIEQNEIKDLLPENIEEFPNLVFFKNERYEDEINVLNKDTDIRDYFNAAFYYNFHDEFKEITKIYFEICDENSKEIYKNNINIILDSFNECKKCKYFSICDVENKKCKDKLFY